MAKAKNVKKPNAFVRWCKDIWAELKKVTWPNFKSVVSKTAIVLGVTIFFLVAVMAMDLGLGQLYKLLVASW